MKPHYFLHDIRTGYPQLPLLDIIFADPPYGTGRIFPDYDDSISNAKSVIRAVVVGAAAALRPGGVLCVLLDHRLNWYSRSLMERQPELRFFNEIVWSFNSGGAGKRRVPHKHATLNIFHKRGAEPFFRVTREPYPRNYGDRKGFHPEGRMTTSVWSVPILSTTDTNRVGYSTEKPTALLKKFFSIYATEGFKVYDPCSGGGSTARAAEELGLEAYASDINPQFKIPDPSSSSSPSLTEVKGTSSSA